MLPFKTMASPTPKRSPNTADAFRKYPPRPPASPPEVVDPIWLLKAVSVVIVAALVCGYGTLCFLLYQGQWQLLLHPRQTASHPAQLDGTPLEFLRFGPDASGLPQRTAWAIPAAPNARYTNITVLFLPSGDGSLADALPTLTLLHDAGLNLLAIDYGGYGESAALHPDNARMTEDASAAWTFLTQSRAVAERNVVLYGAGLGGSLATQLAAQHPAAHGLIVDSPTPDPLQTILADARTKLLPVRLLLHDRFPLAGPLATLKTPKLLLYSGQLPDAIRTAADPKMTLQRSTPAATAQFLQRFLDQLPAQ